MGSFQNRFRAPASARALGAVFAVGRHVFVACAGAASAHITLTDASGADARTRLADGTEVEILAWRPRGSGGTRYHVRATRDGLEGWLAVANLRSTETAETVPAARPPARGLEPARPAAGGNGTRRFGQRGA